MENCKETYVCEGQEVSSRQEGAWWSCHRFIYLAVVFTTVQLFCLLIYVVAQMPDPFMSVLPKTLLPQ